MSLTETVSESAHTFTGHTVGYVAANPDASPPQGAKYHAIAASFTTQSSRPLHSNVGWYGLDAVVAFLQANSGGQLVGLSIHADKSGEPAGEALYVSFRDLRGLTPGTDTEIAFDFPEEATLDLRKTYWVVLEEVSGLGAFEARAAGSANQEGWSIGDNLFRRDFFTLAGRNFQISSDRPFSLRISGYRVHPRTLISAQDQIASNSTDPVLSPIDRGPIGRQQVTKSLLFLPKGRTFDFCTPEFVEWEDSETSARLCTMGSDAHYDYSWTAGHPFLTGSNPSGYTLTGVGIDILKQSSGEALRVSIHAFDEGVIGSQQHPQVGRSVAALNPQSNFDSSPDTFTRPANVHLEPDTLYMEYFYPQNTAHNFKIQLADSAEWDTDEEPGWELVGLGGPPPVSAQTDTTAPTVSSIAITSNPDDDTQIDGIAFDDGVYGIADNIEVTVTFSEDVTITGGPQLSLDIGGSTKTAAYGSTSGSNVVFSYKVAEGDSDTDGIAIPANTLMLNGGTIKDAAENAAGLSHDALPAQTSHKVDGIRPKMSRLASIGGTDGDHGFYTAGEELPIDSEWSEPIRSSYDPTPTIPVDFDGTTKTFTLGNAFGLLSFDYIIRSGDYDADGPTSAADAIQLGTGWIRDRAGNPAVLAHAAFTANSEFKVDAILPYVTDIEIASSPATSDGYTTGEAVEITVTFNETVTVHRIACSDVPGYAKPKIEVGIGGQARIANFHSTNANSVLFTYGVTAGDQDSDGVSVGANKLNLNGGAIWDQAHNSPLTPENGGTPGLAVDVAVTHPALDDASHKVLIGGRDRSRESVVYEASAQPGCLAEVPPGSLARLPVYWLMSDALSNRSPGTS